MKLSKRKVFISTLLSLLLTVNTLAFASPLTQKQINNYENQKDDIEERIEQIESQLEDLDEERIDINRQIDENKKQKVVIEGKIKAIEKEVKAAEEAVQAQQNLFNGRVRAMYINGFEGYLEVLLDSEGISDFISRLGTLKQVIEYDNKIIADLKAERDVINQKKDVIVEEKNRIVEIETTNKAKLEELKRKDEAQTKLLAEFDEKIKKIESKLAANRQAVYALEKEAKSKTTTTVVSRGDSTEAPSSGSAVTAYAAKFIGTPYVWGGASPSGFDCSGFTMYVYAHFGIRLPHSSRAQFGYGTPVSKADLRPGDLVFFKSPISHVGIYWGNGYYIHSPRTGDRVKIAPMTRTDFAGARRLIN